jgi:hypothetical protein
MLLAFNGMGYASEPWAIMWPNASGRLPCFCREIAGINPQYAEVVHGPIAAKEFWVNSSHYRAEG